MPRIRSRKLILWLILWLIAVGIWQAFKPLPEGISQRCTPQPVAADTIAFYRDLRYLDTLVNPVSDREIADAMLAQIADARRWIVLDMFLFNDWTGKSTTDYRPLSRELTEALIAQQQRYPDMLIVLITDPLNTLYGSFKPAHLQRLEAAGIDVVLTNLKPLRDSNPIWSAIWRTGIQWFGNNPEGGWLSNPFTNSHRMTLRGWLAVPNFKANHRKVLLSDAPDYPGGRALVTSANPHDASSLHGNVALQVSGAIVRELLANEQAILNFSASSETRARVAALAQSLPSSPTTQIATTDSAQLGCATEGKIRDTTLDWINRAQLGDTLQIGQFYFSHQGLKQALIDAANRGVGVQLILDPNKDAFGMEKDGTPNRPMAHDLVSAETDMPIEVRWYATHGEQFHSKLLIWQDRDNRKTAVSLGSGNFTRRNIDDYNLETNLTVMLPTDAPLAQEISGYFQQLWNNNGGTFTTDYTTYADNNRYRFWKMRAMEASGLSSF